MRQCCSPGAPGRIRTFNLCDLSAAPLPIGLPERWCGERDSNPQKPPSRDGMSTDCIISTCGGAMRRRFRSRERVAHDAWSACGAFVRMSGARISRFSLQHREPSACAESSRSHALNKSGGRWLVAGMRRSVSCAGVSHEVSEMAMRRCRVFQRTVMLGRSSLGLIHRIDPSLRDRSLPQSIFGASCAGL
jgi:hypothetical protein